MTPHHSFGTHFVIRKSRQDEKYSIVYARISVNGRRAELSLKQKIKPAQWDSGKGKPKGSTPEIKRLALFLDQVKAKLLGIFQQLVLKGEPVSVSLVKSHFTGTAMQHQTFAQLFALHLQNHQGNLTRKTKVNYATTFRFVSEVIAIRFGTEDVPVKRIDHAFVGEFERYIRKRKKGNRPIHHNTVMYHLKRFNVLLDYARDMGWIDRSPFVNYDFKIKKSERGFLSALELGQMEQWAANPEPDRSEGMQLTIDLFLFSCYTGLAYSDLLNLNHDHITTGMDGRKWIYTQRQKTKTAVRVPLMQKALDLIEKYKEHPRVAGTNQVFPYRNNSSLNVRIKEIAKLLGIPKKLTFHMARHTFATTLTLTNGMPIETVSKLLGHSSLAVTQVYAKVVEKKVSEDFKMMEARLEGNGA